VKRKELYLTGRYVKGVKNMTKGQQFGPGIQLEKGGMSRERRHAFDE